MKRGVGCLRDDFSQAGRRTLNSRKTDITSARSIFTYLHTSPPKAWAPRHTSGGERSDAAFWCVFVFSLQQVCITLIGVNPELGQTLASTGLTVWRAAQEMARFMWEHRCECARARVRMWCACVWLSFVRPCSVLHLSFVGLNLLVSIYSGCPLPCCGLFCLARGRHVAVVVT